MLLGLLLCAAVEWKTLQPGVERAELPFGKSVLRVVRIDPSKAELDFGLLSREGGEKRTASRWAEERGFVVAINAGMFEMDHRSNVGRLVAGKHENNPRWKSAYQSALVFGPLKEGLPKAQVLDLDAPGAREVASSYSSLVQNLRLIKSPGVSVWKKNGRAWSEAAVAQDKAGRILFLFTRAPFEMAEWNQLLLATPLEVVRAFHVEGGPEASLSIHHGGAVQDWCGSYETGFTENDGNAEQWPLPNVLGVKR
jgi:hypothetical protein